MPYLLIEGRDLDRRPQRPNAIRCACLTAIDQDLALLRSAERADSARELLARFGSVAGVVAAGAEELLAVPGIGPERARTLQETFRAGPDEGHPAPPG